MDKNTFNHDKFNTWEKCKRRYYLKYIKELKWPESEDNYRLGKSIHALIDYHLRGLKIDHLLKNADEDVKEHWEFMQNLPIMSNDLIITEWAFNSRIGNTKYWINGRIDAVFYDKAQNKYIIADWKTGQSIPKDPENSFQSILYLYGFFKGHKDLKLNLSHKDVAFQYIKTLDVNIPAPVLYSPEKEKEYEQIFLSKINQMENEQHFEKKEPCPLKNCQYAAICKD
jgi:hypothetical protein